MEPEDNGNYVALQRYQDFANEGLWAPLRCDYCLTPLVVQWWGYEPVLRCENCTSVKYPSLPLLASVRKFLKDRGFND